MKTLVSAIALVAVSATASMAGEFSISSWGDRNGKLWTFTHDNGSNWNFYGTSYVNDLKAELAAEQSRVANLASSLAAAEDGVARANTIIAENSVRITELEGMIATLEDNSAAVATLEASVASLQSTVDIQHETILRMSSEAQMYMGLFSDANEEVSRLTAELAIVTADLDAANATIAELSATPTVDNADVVDQHVADLMETVANSTTSSFLTANAIDRFIKNGDLGNNSIEAIIEYDPEGGAALQELRDLRVAAVAAGMTHDAYGIHDYNRTAGVEGHTQVVDSRGVAQDETFVTVTINGKSFSSATVNHEGATLGTTFGAGESAADWVQGFEDGYNAGYEDGYADGFADGYAAGVSDSQ